MSNQHNAKPPSYVAKLWRAKKHLIDLEAAIRDFNDTAPYAIVTHRDSAGRLTYRLRFTHNLHGTEVPLIAADLIMNLRSSLDHLMNALVQKQQRGKATFPVYFSGVWEPPVRGENAERLKSRERWASDTKTVRKEAVDVLKGFQPSEDAPDTFEPSTLRALNALANRDRHQRLPVVVGGLRDVEYWVTNRDGSISHAELVFEEKSLFAANASLPIPVEKRRGAPPVPLKVRIRGVPEVLIELRGSRPGLPALAVDIPRALAETMTWVETTVFPLLLPYVQTGEWVGSVKPAIPPLEMTGDARTDYVAEVVALIASAMTKPPERTDNVGEGESV